MNIITAERRLTKFVAERLGMLVDTDVFRGAMPTGQAGVRVRFESGRPCSGDLAEFVAEVFGVFNEPDEALGFADRLFSGLPEYGAEEFVAIAPDGDIRFEEKNGFFTAVGKLKVAFA